MIAGFGLAVVGALYVIGGLGEPVRPQLSDPPLALYLGVRALGLTLAAVLVALGVATALQARWPRGGTGT